MAARKRTTKAGAARPRRDIEAEVTAKVMEALESGTVPWRKPWRSRTGQMPTSVSTGRPYRGMNVWLLTIAAAEGGYASPYWLTYRQAEQRGGTVRKGEHGTLVVFWKKVTVADPQPDDLEHRKAVLMLRHYTVFNLDQCDGVQLPRTWLAPEDEVEVDSDERGEALWDAYAGRPELRHVAGDAAYYSPATDTITLPAKTQFSDTARYYSTLYHEATHSTGHAKRLDRFAKNGEPDHFGGALYAKEELVAEMGAAMLLALAGIDTDESSTQSAAYVQNWLQVLREDKKLVLAAAGQAQRAVDAITGQATYVASETREEDVA
jgi:antirestriction protein ArdC